MTGGGKMTYKGNTSTITTKTMAEIRDAEAEKYAPMDPSNGHETALEQLAFQAGWDARHKLDNEQLDKYKALYSNCSKSHDKIEEALKLATLALKNIKDQWVIYHGTREDYKNANRQQIQYAEDVLAEIHKLRGK